MSDLLPIATHLTPKLYNTGSTSFACPPATGDTCATRFCSVQRWNAWQGKRGRRASGSCLQVHSRHCACQIPGENVLAEGSARAMTAHGFVRLGQSSQCDRPPWHVQAHGGSLGGSGGHAAINVRMRLRGRARARVRRQNIYIRAHRMARASPGGKQRGHTNTPRDQNEMPAVAHLHSHAHAPLALLALLGRTGRQNCSEIMLRTPSLALRRLLLARGLV